MDQARTATGLRAGLPLVIAGFVISFVVIGGGIDTVSVFLNAIAKSSNWSRSGLSLAVSVGAASAALSTPLVGLAVDRFGVRVPMTAGVALLAVGFGCLMKMTEVAHFVIANLFLGAGFAACALLPITVAVTVHIPQRTTLALGIVGAGSSAGALVLAPTVQRLIDAFGWHDAYVILGIAVVLTPLPFLAFALPRGRLRRGDGSVTPPPGTSLMQDLKRRSVLPLTALMVLPSLAGFSVSVHLVPYLSGLGHAGTLAAAALGATIGISAIGKVAGGYVADRFGALPTLRFALLLWAGALVLLARATGVPTLAAFVLIYGLAFGTQIAVIPAIAVTVLGSERFGALFGILQLAAMLASAVGPVVSGIIFDATGGYAGALVMWIAATLFAALVAFVMREAPVVAVEEVIA